MFVTIDCNIFREWQIIGNFEVTILHEQYFDRNGDHPFDIFKIDQHFLQQVNSFSNDFCALLLGACVSQDHNDQLFHVVVRQFRNE